MKKMIYKYELGQSIDATNLKFLSAGVQHGVPVAWAEWDLDYVPTGHRLPIGWLRSYVTGSSIHDHAVYIGTVQTETKELPGGYFVQHLYWVPEE